MMVNAARALAKADADRIAVPAERRKLMPNSISRDEVQRLFERGEAQLVEVLPPQEYEAEHIAGAINIPLKRLNRESVMDLDKGLPVIVY